MCDALNSAAPSTCMSGCRFLCSNLEHCPNAQSYFSSRLTRLCDIHTDFCRFCGKPFCPSCIESHQAECIAKRVQVLTVAELVERALGRMGV